MHAASGSGISSVHACVFLFALPPSSTMPEKLISDASRQSLVTQKNASFILRLYVKRSVTHKTTSLMIVSSDTYSQTRL